MARFALKVNILIVTYRTSFNNNTFLLSFNKLVRRNAFRARSISDSVTIFATLITFNTFCHE
jgi:hypothetical protein